MLKKSAFYIGVVLFIFAGQFLATSGLVTGKPPQIPQNTLDGQKPMQILARGPALLYFWAEWCGICRSMQDNVDNVLKDHPGITIAERSSNSEQLKTYLTQNKLGWPVVDDADGTIGQSYGVSAVPALFFVNAQGEIVFTSVGYTSEWGLRFRLWLTNLL